MKEREEAKALFKSRKGKEIQKEISKRAKTFVPGSNITNVAKNKGIFVYYIKELFILLNIQVLLIKMSAKLGKQFHEQVLWEKWKDCKECYNLDKFQDKKAAYKMVI